MPRIESTPSEKISRVALPPFVVWRNRLGITRQEAADLLGRTPRQLFTYEQAEELPRTLVLAMAALEFLAPWRLESLDIKPTWRDRRRR